MALIRAAKLDGQCLIHGMIMQFINGSDHGVVARYFELYEDGQVKHINGVWPVFLFE